MVGTISVQVKNSKKVWIRDFLTDLRSSKTINIFERLECYHLILNFQSDKKTFEICLIVLLVMANVWQHWSVSLQNAILTL